MTCDLNHTEDQRQILDAAKTLLNTSYPISRLHNGHQDNLNQIAEFGAFSLALPEQLGGAGFTLVEEVLLHVLFGHHLISTNAIAAPLAARLAGILGKVELANDIVSGAISVSAAIYAEDSVFLIEAQEADIALLFSDDELEIIQLEGAKYENITNDNFDVGLKEIKIKNLNRLGKSGDETLLNISSLLISAQLLGIAEATRDSAVAYAQIRQQFGRPIGSFQAIKHHCANMAISAEILSAQLDMATISQCNGFDDANFQVTAVTVLAAREALKNARHCIQIHGGMGFSAEADPHHFLKKAHVLNQMNGRGSVMLNQTAPLTPHSN